MVFWQTNSNKSGNCVQVQQSTLKIVKLAQMVWPIWFVLYLNLVG
jgi:hypothetical protein